MQQIKKNLALLAVNAASDIMGDFHLGIVEDKCFWTTTRCNCECPFTYFNNSSERN